MGVMCASFRNGCRRSLCKVHRMHFEVSRQLPHLGFHMWLWLPLPHRLEKMCNPADTQIVSWILLYDFVMAFNHGFPKGVEFRFASWGQIQPCCTWEKFKHEFVLSGIEHDCKFVGEFHILIIHENHHPWENSGQLTNWIPAAFFPAGVLNKKTYWE